MHILTSLCEMVAIIQVRSLASLLMSPITDSIVCLFSSRTVQTAPYGQLRLNSWGNSWRIFLEMRTIYLHGWATLHPFWSSGPVALQYNFLAWKKDLVLIVESTESLARYSVSSRDTLGGFTVQKYFGAHYSFLDCFPTLTVVST